MHHLIRLLFVCFCTATALQATPAQVILIRHAEKPDTGNTLSKRGYERADALAPFFINHSLYTQYGTPIAIYAQLPKSKGDSIRAIETVTPLAEALNMILIIQFTKDQEKDCAEAILSNDDYNGKMVLCCFEHQSLQKLADKLGIKSAPKWPGSVYDWVWVINYDDKGNGTLQTFPQQLMYGDSKSTAEKLEQRGTKWLKKKRKKPLHR